MDKVVEIENQKGTFMFDCPGCKCSHQFWTEHPEALTGPKWTFNGDKEKPTVSPSLLVRYPTADGMKICHSFIRDGRIEYLSDCTHELAGQTVELPNIN